MDERDFSAGSEMCNIYAVYKCIKRDKILNTRDLLLCTVDELIFIGPFPAGPHTLVLPEDLCMVIKLLERERRLDQRHTTTRNNCKSGAYCEITKIYHTRTYRRTQCKVHLHRCRVGQRWEKRNQSN